MVHNNSDAAPHCPSCGYNLYGLPYLHCPECGKKVASKAELERARWLATRNAPDRQAVWCDRIAAALGAALLALGILMCALHLRTRVFLGGYLFLRFFGGGLILTLAYLYELTQMKERLTIALVVLGTLWFLVGFAFWYPTV